MKFFVTYQMPHSGLDEWMQLPEEERQKQETEMKAIWQEWLDEHKAMIVETKGVGRPKRITKNSVTDERNDLMMYSLVEAPSLEEATAIFKDHPHFGIPGAWIEVMSTKELE